MATIGALNVKLGIDTAEFANGLKNAQSSLSKFGSYAKAGLLAAGAAAAVAAFGEEVAKVPAGSFVYQTGNA